MLKSTTTKPKSQHISKTRSALSTKLLQSKPLKSKLRQIKSKSHRYLSTTATSTTQSTTTSTTSSTPTPPNSGPVTQILLHTVDDTNESFTLRRNSEYRIKAPNIAYRLFTQDDDFTRALPSNLISTDKTLGHLAQDILQSFPIKPSFISFSTTDHEFGRLYFTREQPFQLYHGAYSSMGLKFTNIIDVVQNSITNPNTSGIPPIQQSLFKYKAPILPIPFFNNPEFIEPKTKPTDAIQISNALKARTAEKRAHVVAPKTIAQLLGFSQKNPKIHVDQDESTTVPEFYNPKQTNIPLHPHTPLYDINNITHLQCHVSYSQDQINKNPILSSFVNKHQQLFVDMYPSLSTDDPTTQFKTIKYHITPHGHALEQTFESKSLVSPRLLFALLGIYGTTKLGFDIYESYVAKQAELAGLELNKNQLHLRNPLLLGSSTNPYAELTELQRERSRLLGQSKLYDIELREATTIKERWEAYQDGVNPFLQIFNPWGTLPQAYLDLKSGKLDLSTLVADDALQQESTSSSPSPQNQNETVQPPITPSH